MKTLIVLLLSASCACAQIRQVSGSSGSVAGSASSPVLSSTALAGQPVVGDASGGAFGTRGGMMSIFEETVISLDVPEEAVSLPTEFAFEQNYPNPFNPSTTFRFSLPRTAPASLVIYDELGRTVGTVFERELAAGTHSVQFNSPAHMSSGIYFAVFRAGEFQQVRKMLLMK